MQEDLPVDDRQFRALTGVRREEFEKLLEMFIRVYEEEREKEYEGKERKRKRGGGRKGKLRDMDEKLFFILSYLKGYPTFDKLGYDFGLERSNAYRNVQRLTQVLLKTLERQKMLPKREYNSREEMQTELAQLKVRVDATERRINRPQEPTEQKNHYSGKKSPYSEEQLDDR